MTCPCSGPDATKANKASLLDKCRFPSLIDAETKNSNKNSKRKN